MRCGPAKDFELFVTEKSTRTVGTDQVTEIKGNETDTVTGNATRKVKKDYKIDIEKALTIDADSITLTGNKKITLKVGSSQIEISSSGIKVKSGTVTLDATNLTAKGKSSFKISGANGTVQASANLNLKGLQLKAEGSVQAELKGGAMAAVKGSGLAQVQGGIVKIN